MGFLAVLADYCVNSQLHGLKFIGEPGRHWSERVFWFICVCGAWFGCFELLLSTLDSFSNNAISFGTETTYIEWNTSLFSITICEDDNEDLVGDYADKMYGVERDYNLDAVVQEIAFFKGKAPFMAMNCEGELDCPKSGYLELALKIRTPCNETFTSCSWMNKTFDCCQHFQILETEFGPCFALNSRQIPDMRPYPLISNHIIGAGTLHVEINVPSTLYIHGPNDVPNSNTRLSDRIKVTMGGYVYRSYKVTDIANDDEVLDIAVEKRKCRFDIENYLQYHHLYSYSACIVECRAAAQLRLCNCTNHFMPIGSTTACDMQGLLCLARNFYNLNSLINPWSTGEGLICSCLSGCSDPEYDQVEEQTDTLDEDFAVVELALNQLSTMQYKRSVTRGKLDLVVSMGGTVGLFVGASLLSLVELIYFFTIRLYNSHQINKRKMNVKKVEQSPTTGKVISGYI